MESQTLLVILLVGAIWLALAVLRPATRRRGRPKGGKADRLFRDRRAGRRGATGRPIVLDGSNLLHWTDGPPSLEPVRAAVAELARRGFRPGVIFDANVGYRIGERYLDDRPMAKLLGLPEDQVLVVPKGVPADAYILDAASGLGARIVTNDRYRDWAETHPDVAVPDRLVRGGWKDGKLWLGRLD